ncbi:MAG: RNA 3'-terminal phosphate cyclase [Candidatus Micrarchaeota archaeon]|nr:RNA 3'-terminal phosphate cyclase [Candidatus Micrarchaeota archaeon]
MIEINGSYLEGGGQIIRTSLSLSALSGKPFHITGIRAGRAKPGLQPQHKACVEAVGKACGAAFQGAEIGSIELVFEPGEISGGSYRFDIGTAGSTTLLLQSLLPLLVFAPAVTRVELIGGTENPMAPSALYLQNVFIPMVRRMGLVEKISLEKWGWYPKGGGVLAAEVEPARELKALDLVSRGALEQITGSSVVSNLPMHIADRQKAAALKKLAEAGLEAKVGVVDAPSAGQGTELFLCAKYANSSAGFSSLGERGKPAEKVGGEAAQELVKFNAGGAAAEEHLADQILLYLALARGESRLGVSRVSRHLLTNAWVVQKFLDARITVDGREGGPGTVAVSGVGYVNKH